MNSTKQNTSLQGEIVIYKANNDVKIEVVLNDETVWLSQSQIVQLFQSSKANISEHIKSIYQQNELDRDSTVRNSEQFVLKEIGKCSEILHIIILML
jgi:hypothetical protein